METLSASQNTKLSQFMEFNEGVDLDVALEYLQAATWNLEEATANYLTRDNTSSDNNNNNNNNNNNDDNNTEVAGDEFENYHGVQPSHVDRYHQEREHDPDRNVGQRSYIENPIRPTSNSEEEQGQGQGQGQEQEQEQEQDSNIRSADRAYTEQMLPRNYNVFSGSAVDYSQFPREKDMGGEWNKVSKTPRTEHLASIFRDPSYKYPGSWEEVKLDGQKQNKWILVNIQAADKFASHVLNRDFWNKPEIVEFVQRHFIFFQYERSTGNGRQFCTYYNIMEFPHISVIDPHTGRKEHIIPVPSANHFPHYSAILYDALRDWIKEVPDTTAKLKRTSSTKLTANNRQVSSPESNETVRNESIKMDDENEIKIDSRDMQVANDDEKTMNINTPTEREIHNHSPSSGSESNNVNKIQNIPSSKEIDPEPAASEQGVTTLRVRFSSGEVIQRRFKTTALVEDIYQFLANKYQKNVNLVLIPNTISLNENRNKTLKELNLERATLQCSFD